MDIANAQSARLGFISDELRQRIRQTLAKVWATVDFPEIDLEKYVSILRKDKKNVDQDVRVILTRGLGEMYVDRVEVDSAFLNTIADCFASFRHPSG